MKDKLFKALSNGDFSPENVFFTSDTHFGHGNIIKYCDRPYLTPAEKNLLENERSGGQKLRISKESIEVMNTDLINHINSMVGKDDVLFHLGDFCFASKNHYYEKAQEYRDRINCKNIIFISGNHDHRTLQKIFPEYHSLMKVRIGKHKFVLCHYAISIWEDSHKGSIHLYGHSHAGAENSLDAKFPGRRSMDVGVDNAFRLKGECRPFQMTEILDIMESRKGYSVDPDA